jgi:hypothetical protein
MPLKSLVVAALALVVAAAPASAQKSGSSNRNAPAVSQSITLGADTVEVNYISITWAAGQWAEQLANEATRAEFRATTNKNAERAPLGSLKCSSAIQLGSTKVAAGTYKLAFTLDEAFKWQITLTSEAGAIVVPLELKQAEEESRRLVAGLRAGEKDFTAEVAIAFGKNRCVLPITIQK